jgi:hypothetical protein
LWTDLLITLQKMMVHPLLFILLSYTVADPLLFELYNHNASNYDPWKLYAGSYGFNNSMQGVRFPANGRYMNEPELKIHGDTSFIRLRKKGIVYSGSGKSENTNTYATFSWTIVYDAFHVMCEFKFPAYVQDLIQVSITLDQGRGTRQSKDLELYQSKYF